MPRISEFYGIVVFMNFGDHDPPHFHVRYGEFRATFSIDPIAIDRGTLPRRAQSFVTEWATLHQGELMDNWKHAKRNEPVRRIEPLA